MNTQKPLLPASIEMRAIARIEKGIDPIEAVKLAIEEENNTIWLAMEGIDMKTGRMHKEVKEAIQKDMCERVYNRINSKS